MLFNILSFLLGFSSSAVALDDTDAGHPDAGTNP